MYNELKSSLRKHFDFIILDIICMEASFVLAYFIRFRRNIILDSDNYNSIFIILLLSNIITFYIFNSMQDVLKRSKQLEFYATFKHTALVEIFLLIYLFATKTTDVYSRNMMGIFPILYLFLSYITRLIYKVIVKKLIKFSADRNIVIITTKDNKDIITEKIEKSVNDIIIKNIFVIDDYNVNNKNDIIKFLLSEHVDEVLVSVKYDFGNGIVNDIMSQITIMGIPLHIEIPYNSHIFGQGSKLFVEDVAGIETITCTLNTISHVQLFVKRFFDIIISIIGIIFTLFFTIIIGPIIYINSPGPIFFTQKRVGRNGKNFNIIKFRSMVMNAEELKKDLLSKNDNESSNMFKMKNDPRIIKGVGNFIRKTSIDEFPQFINVLKGDMSVVGTRPPTVDEWERYEMHHRARLAIKPGITGLWQVSGRSEIKNFEDVVKLDSKYIKNFSLWQDFSIILKTFKVILSGRGAE